MSQLNSDYYARCIATLDRAFTTLKQLASDDDLYDIYRAACVKEFEIILEQTGKLLKKCLKPYFSSSKQVDQLNFKDVFRYAAKHGLISLEEAERWLIYRDNRNDTAHDYGVGFADDTLALLPNFIRDAYRVNEAIKNLP
jgi:nucleotidyltransferase substrate binding protein (TIGR01987 family)